MKKLLLFIGAFALFTLNVNAQLPFLDDMESYNVGDYIHNVGPYTVKKVSEDVITAATDGSDGQFLTMLPYEDSTGMVLMMHTGPAFGGMTAGDYTYKVRLKSSLGKPIKVKTWGGADHVSNMVVGEHASQDWEDVTCTFTISTGDADTIYNVMPVIYSWNPQEVYVDNISIVNNTTGVSYNQDFSFVASPNPSNGIFNLKSEKEILEYSIVNAAGQTIETVKNVNSKNVNINLSSFAKGVYFIRVKDVFGNTKIVKEVIK